MQLAFANSCHGAAIGREVRIDPPSARQLCYFPLRPRDDIDVARENEEQLLAILR